MLAGRDYLLSMLHMLLLLLFLYLGYFALFYIHFLLVFFFWIPNTVVYIVSLSLSCRFEYNATSELAKEVQFEQVEG